MVAMPTMVVAMTAKVVEGVLVVILYSPVSAWLMRLLFRARNTMSRAEGTFFLRTRKNTGAGKSGDMSVFERGRENKRPKPR